MWETAYESYCSLLLLLLLTVYQFFILLHLIGLVQSFLSWKAFIPLSRLTYGAYLIHPMTIIVFYQSKLSGRAYTDMDLVRHTSILFHNKVSNWSPELFHTILCLTTPLSSHCDRFNSWEALALCCNVPHNTLLNYTIAMPLW